MNHKSAPGISEDELRYLCQHDISMALLLNAYGLRRSEYVRLMKEQGLWFAFNAPPCKAAGHTLRSRAGHCIVCRPSAIAFTKRYSAFGSVYIAQSVRLGLVKIGSTAAAVEDRLAQLNFQGYGGTSDWSLRFKKTTPNSGKVEFEAHRLLARHAVTGILYERNGEVSECRELFACSLAEAHSILELALRTDEMKG